MATKKIGKQMIMVLTAITFSCVTIMAQSEDISVRTLTENQQSIIVIAALTAQGELPALKPALNKGLDAGLTINQIKEVIVHLYAYCGFPRSIRGLQTFMEVLDERKARGINDPAGVEASLVPEELPKYERGKKVLGELTKLPQDGPLTGYAAFAPVMDSFLKEHLFADIFERDVLTYTERELVTISVISAIGGAEPMLRSHLNICLNVGLSPDQLRQFILILKSTAGKKEAKAARNILNEVLDSRI